MGLNSQAETFDRWMRLQNDVLLPLGRQRNRDELVEVAENILSEEADPEFRQLLIGGVSSILHVNGWEDESLAWRRRAIAEAGEDPVAHNGLATWCFYNPLREANREDLDDALAHSAVAVEKARTSNTWRRFVLYDRCRIATAAKRYDIVAEAMMEILKIWEDPCEPDIPVFEWDWLATIPETAIAPGLLKRYREVIDRVLKSRGGSDEIGGGLTER